MLESKSFSMSDLSNCPIRLYYNILFINNCQEIRQFVTKTKKQTNKNVKGSLNKLAKALRKMTFILLEIFV